MEATGNNNNPDPLASAKKRRQELIEEILKECEWEDPKVTREEIIEAIDEVAIPMTNEQLWDRGLNDSVTPRFWLWHVDYNLCVHFLTEGHTPVFDTKWPIEIGPEGETVPQYQVYVEKRLEAYAYLWTPRNRPAANTEGNAPQSQGEASGSDSQNNTNVPTKPEENAANEQGK